MTPKVRAHHINSFIATLITWTPIVFSRDWLQKNFHASWWGFNITEPNDEIESLKEKFTIFPFSKLLLLLWNLIWDANLLCVWKVCWFLVLCFTSFSFPINFASIRHQWVTFCIVSRKQKSWADEQLSRERDYRTSNRASDLWCIQPFQGCFN